jgi:protein-tyrosine phosphatase
MEYSEISPNLYVGPCPKTPEDIDTLKEMGISSVLNLQTIDDERYLNIQWKALKRHYDSCGIEVHRVPVRDFDPVHLEEKLPVCVRELHDVLSASHIAYLHCTAGCGRSPTVAIAYLTWHRGMTLTEAQDYVLCRRQCSPTIEAIRQATPTATKMRQDQ